MRLCPWCDSDDLVINYTDYTCVNSTWAISCYKCKAVGPRYKSKKEAIESWNKRTILDNYAKIELKEKENYDIKKFMDAIKQAIYSLERDTQVFHVKGESYAEENTISSK